MPCLRRGCGKMRGSGSNGKPARGRGAADLENSVPMMAIFGGFFGILLVFLVLVNLFTGEAARERLEQAGEDGLYRIERQDKSGSGFMVITFPGALRIVETGQRVQLGAVCPGGSSAFSDYARNVYENQGDQLVFFMLEGSVPVMAEARECLRNFWPDQAVTIGWVIADTELLKSVSLNDIPAHIRGYVEER